MGKFETTFANVRKAIPEIIAKDRCVIPTVAPTEERASNPTYALVPADTPELVAKMPFVTLVVKTEDLAWRRSLVPVHRELREIIAKNFRVLRAALMEEFVSGIAFVPVRMDLAESIAVNVRARFIAKTAVFVRCPEINVNVLTVIMELNAIKEYVNAISRYENLIENRSRKSLTWNTIPSAKAEFPVRKPDPNIEIISRRLIEQFINAPINPKKAKTKKKYINHSTPISF